MSGDIRRMNLITGITGMLGTHVAIDLLRRGSKVAGLIRPGGSKTALLRSFEFYGVSDLADQITWLEGDVLDVISLQEAISSADTVYHCAAVVSYHPADRKAMYKVNVEGTANVVNACIAAGNRTLVHVSSIAAIGRTGAEQALKEESPWVESSHTTHYAITKHLSEMEVWRGIQEGLRAVIFNSGFIIGPGDFSRSSAALFTRLSRSVPFYPPGGTGFITASDAAKCLVELTVQKHHGERFIGVAENRLMRDIFTLVSGALGQKSPKREVRPYMLWIALLTETLREWISGKKALVTREIIGNMKGVHKYDNSKLTQAIGIEFETIDSAIAHTARLFRGQSGKIR